MVKQRRVVRGDELGLGTRLKPRRGSTRGGNTRDGEQRAGYGARSSAQRREPGTLEDQPYHADCVTRSREALRVVGRLRASRASRASAKATIRTYCWSGARRDPVSP